MNCFCGSFVFVIYSAHWTVMGKCFNSSPPFRLLFLRNTTLHSPSDSTSWGHDNIHGGNISLWLSARHPVSIAAVQPDNACLSIYIRGILILFLCLGWGRGGLGAGILWMPLFTGDRSKASQTLAWKKTTDYTSSVPHPTATILLDLLSEGYYSLLVWEGGLCSLWLRSWLGEMIKRWRKTWLDARATAASVIEAVMTIWFHQAGQGAQENRLLSMSKSGWVGEAQLCFWFIVGFLAEHARGLSSVPTLDTERMWRCKVRCSHISHRNLEAHSGAKLAGQRPRRDLLSAVTILSHSSLLFSWE